MSAVAIIPARGGSRRIPRKNIREFHGKPIIAYSIEAAMDTGLFHHVYVSTEDEEISRVAMEYGGSLLPRPQDLAEDSIGTQAVMAHGIRYLRSIGYHDTFACCIYPCAPLITADDLQDAYALAYGRPYNYVYAEGQFYFGVAMRFIASPNDFSNSKRLVDPRYIDINTLHDWHLAEQMFAARQQEEAA